jgi:subtilase family serine protease
MKRFAMLLASVGLLVTAVQASVPAASATASRGAGVSTPHRVATMRLPKGLHGKAVCPQTAAMVAQCLAVVLADKHGKPYSSLLPSGFGPADFQAAYNLPSSNHGEGITVGIVDAYHDPNVEADLAVYRSTYGLPACTTANGCFKEITSAGNTRWARTNANWAVETSLDVDAVSAVCPNCHILLVESYGGWITGLGKAENEAVKLGATVVSNSYANRTKNHKKRVQNIEQKYYNHPGVAIVAGSGDWGYNDYHTFPTGSQYVVSVGGTYLKRDDSKRGWSETAWAGDGSGCSPYDAKPAWQKDTGCKTRTSSDISADASPTSGAAVYDTYSYPGWVVVGGTSLATPLIAGTFALAGDSITYAQRVYQNPADLNDVTSGSNGSCGGSYLCTAGPGYDGPTGLGTPNGIGDF